MNWLRWIERIAWIAGIAMLAIYAGTRASAERARLDGIAAIEAARHVPSNEAPLSDGSASNGSLLARSSPEHEAADTSEWSPARIAAWREASTIREPPQAVLRIPAVELIVPVFDGTSDKNLNRGAGRIEGTAQIGASGNVGLAAHRDGYFRALKDVRVGDDLQLTTPRDVFTYRIVETSIVDPTAVEVLAPTTIPSVTLVTCYPFYFVGSAPQRFIVRAELVQERRSS